MHTGISLCPHDFLESNSLVSVSIYSGVVGDKKKEFTWRDRRFFIFASVVLDEPVGLKFASAEVTKLWLNASAINFVDE